MISGIKDPTWNTNRKGKTFFVAWKIVTGRMNRVFKGFYQ